MVGSDYYPDVASNSADIDAQNAGIDAEILRARPQNQNTWLQRLAKTLGIDTGPQGQQTPGQQQERAQTAQTEAQTTTQGPGMGSAGAGAGYQPGAKAGQWMTQNPQAIGKGMRAQRQGEAIGSLGHTVGTIIRLIASMGAGGAAGAAGAGGAGAGAGAAGAAGAGAGAASGFMGADASGAAAMGPTSETLTPGGSPETAAVSYGGLGGRGFGGGSTGGGLSQLAQNYFGGSGGGDTYSKILRIMQEANQSGTASGTSMAGGTGGVSQGGGAPWIQSAADTMSLVQGTPQKRQQALAAVEGLDSLTSTGGMAGGGSNIPWAT